MPAPPKPGPREVDTPTGGKLTVKSHAEMKHYEGLRERYMAEHAFTEASDLADLERLLSYEVQVFRMTRALSSGEDEDGIPVGPADAAAFQKSLREINGLISAVKTDLGMTRRSRNSQVVSLPEYIADLKRRAREFGVHRERQLDEGISIMMDLRSAVQTFYRSNESERRRTGFKTEADLVEWIRDTLIPRFDAVDEHFRENQQKYWAGTL